MSVVVVGLNHKTAPLTLLERLTIPEERLVKALQQLTGYEHVLEGAVLSTCNRVEIYGAVDRFHAGAQNLRDFLAEFCHVAPEDFSDHLYTYHDDGAVRQLFRVAAGIDSMIIGESEILGQVRRAFQLAVEEGSAQREIGGAFRRALRVGKRARTETAIGRNPVSVSSAAVELARRAFSIGSLAGKTVAIVGAGKMGTLAARALKNAGTGEVIIVNRTDEKARRLAATFDAEARPFEDLDAVLATADIVISSTTSMNTVIELTAVERAVAHRSRPLLLVDIAVPRDVDPSVGMLEGVVLRDIDDLRGVVEESMGSRMGEVAKVEEIISEEIDRFVRWQRAGEVAPTVAALMERGETVRTEEIDRMRVRLASLAPEQLETVEHLTKKIVGRLLHSPLHKVKELSTSVQGRAHVAALRELFELDDDIDD